MADIEVETDLNERRRELRNEAYECIVEGEACAIRSEGHYIVVVVQTRAAREGSTPKVLSRQYFRGMLRARAVLRGLGTLLGSTS